MFVTWAASECESDVDAIASLGEARPQAVPSARAAADLAAGLGPNWEMRCRALTFALLRPEAIAGRRARLVIESLSAYGFSVSGAERVRASRNMARDLKRHQLGDATPELLQALDVHSGIGDGLLVLLRDTQPTAGWDASERLRWLKGHAKPHRRLAGQLRHQLGTVTELLSWVHTPDSSLDLIRELGVLCDAEERRELVSATSPRLARAALDEQIDALYADYPVVCLNVAAALRRVERAVRLVDADSRERAASVRILRALGSGSSDWQIRRRLGQECRWQAPLAFADQHGASVSGWDRLLISSCFVKQTSTALQRAA